MPLLIASDTQNEADSSALRPKFNWDRPKVRNNMINTLLGEVRRGLRADSSFKPSSIDAVTASIDAEFGPHPSLNRKNTRVQVGYLRTR